MHKGLSFSSILYSLRTVTDKCLMSVVDGIEMPQGCTRLCQDLFHVLITAVT